MSQITFIGGEGSGKTVLLSVLADRHKERLPGRIWFNPVGKTLKHVGEILHTLRSGDWPASTTTGVREELRWNVVLSDQTECDVLALDCAGQDLRRLFDGNSPPAELGTLSKALNESQVVCFLLNLGDFVGQPEDKRLDNELLLKVAMDELVKTGRSCALILTQVDRYRYLKQEHDSWAGVLRKYAPTLHAAHIVSGSVALFPVAAVAETEVRFDPKEIKALEVPKQNFTSIGLEEVVRWMDEKLTEHAPPPSTPPPPPPKKSGIGWQIAAAVGIAFLLLVSCGKKTCVQCNGSGQITCSQCSGSGKISGLIWDSKCDSCAGTGRVRCPACGGEGKR